MAKAVNFIWRAWMLTSLFLLNFLCRLPIDKDIVLRLPLFPLISMTASEVQQVLVQLQVMLLARELAPVAGKRTRMTILTQKAAAKKVTKIALPITKLHPQGLSWNLPKVMIRAIYISRARFILKTCKFLRA